MKTPESAAQEHGESVSAKNEFPENPVDLASSFRKMFRRPENFSLAGGLVLFAAMCWVTIEAMEKAEAARSKLRELLINGFDPEPTGEIKSWLAISVVILAGLLFLLFMYSAVTFLIVKKLRRQQHPRRGLDTDEREALEQAKTSLEVERDALQARVTTLDRNIQEIFSSTIEAAKKIRDQLPTDIAGNNRTIESVQFSYHVSKCFDAEVHRRYRIRAGQNPVYFWQTFIGVSSDAFDSHTFLDIRYQLISHDPGTDAVYLPTKNDLHSKEACIFFVPKIEPGEVREIEIVYHWPGMLRGLRETGSEDFWFNTNNATELLKYKFEIFLEPGSGGSLAISKKGTRMPNLLPESIKSDLNWPGVTYTASNVPPQLLSNGISVSVDWISH